MLFSRDIQENHMRAIIKQIQEALEHGRPLDVKTGPITAQVLKEMQKNSSASNEEINQREVS